MKSCGINMKSTLKLNQYEIKRAIGAISCEVTVWKGFLGLFSCFSSVYLSKAQKSLSRIPNYLYMYGSPDIVIGFSKLSGKKIINLHLL